MSVLEWDKTGERRYETGVDKGVLYLPDPSGIYDTGFAWNGLTTVTESPSGAESTKQYADNTTYLTLTSAEEFGATVEAFMYPNEFAQCDGTAEVSPGIYLGQQNRTPFGLCYRSRVGNDLQGADFGYKLHLIYNAKAAPSERAFSTINDSPEAITFSWELTTVPVYTGVIEGTEYKPTASITIDSTKVDADALENLEALLYGTIGTDPSLPTPAEVIALFEGTITVATPTAPTFNSGTHVITIPSVTGVIYTMDGVVLTSGAQAPIASTKLVKAKPAAGYKFPAITDDDWLFTYV